MLNMDFSMNLKKLGWDSFFEEHFTQYAEMGFCPGRIAAGHKTVYILYTEFGELSAGITGKIRYETSNRGDFPVVGDWVAIKPRLEERYATIHGTLPRKSSLLRKVPGRKTEEQLLAANIDTAFWVSSLNRIFNLRRIERFLIMVNESGARPAIILNKADLCSIVEKKVKEVESIAQGVPVHVTSAFKGWGLEELTRYIQDGRTVVFLGLSGVGKSTILNKLVGKDIQKVEEIRAHDDRGRHTTAARFLVHLPQGGYAIDTPGIRELQLWDTTDRVHETFEDIEEIAQHCRFNDCRHETEPFCAVNKAVKDGFISLERLKNYKKMLEELDYLDIKKKVKTKIIDKKNAKVFKNAQINKKFL